MANILHNTIKSPLFGSGNRLYWLFCQHLQQLLIIITQIVAGMFNISLISHIG